MLKLMIAGLFSLARLSAVLLAQCSEISSIFLVFCDFDVYFPAKNSGSPAWSAFIMFNQAAFVVLFFCYRVVGWIVSLGATLERCLARDA